MSRARLYVLIDGFEQDMRALIEGNLLAYRSERDLMTDQEYSLVRARRDLDEAGEEVSLIHYLDLQTAYELMLRSKAQLPVSLTDELSGNAAAIAQLVPVRHRVMHGRPLNSGDTSKASILLFPFQSPNWPRTKATISRLRLDPTWEPFFEKLPVPFERTLHNLPEVDYDETSFIGRKSEAQKLLDELKRRRHSVITVTGEGGIGKTATALDVAYRLLDSDDNPYDAILWVSLKTEKLTAYGVEELRSAIRGIDQTVAEIGRGISNDFNGSLEELAEALDGIEALIIIDNLESAQGDEIVNMYDHLPISVNYLFTSRLGIGQLERRFPLPPLSGPEAQLLLRKFAAVRDQKRLSGLSEKSIASVVEQLRFSPLAIRWYVLSSEAGRVPLDVLRNQKELLDFCIKNVYDQLSENSRAVLSILRSLDRAIGFDEFAVLTDFTIDDLRMVTQELTQGSLVVVEAETAGGIAGKLALTPTARTFIARPDHTGSFIAEVLKRERTYKVSLEQENASKLGYIDLTKVLMRDDNDKPAVFLLKKALKSARSRRYDSAYGDIERAKSFNPEFSEVYRVSGYLNNEQGHYEAALTEFQTALTYAHEGEPAAYASYALADVLSTKLHNAALAVPHARRAAEELPNGGTQFLLGKLLVWVGEYAEGQELLENALEGASGRHRRVVGTVLIDSWSRWASDEMSKHDYSNSRDRAVSGFRSGLKLLDASALDERLTDAVAECAIVMLKTVSRSPSGVSNSFASSLAHVSAFASEHRRNYSERKRRLLVECLGAAASALGVHHPLSGEFRRALAKISA